MTRLVGYNCLERGILQSQEGDIMKKIIDFNRPETHHKNIKINSRADVMNMLVEMIEPLEAKNSITGERFCDTFPNTKAFHDRLRAILIAFLNGTI